MHGLINRSIQCFLRDTYGHDTWVKIATDAEIGIDEFEALLRYDPTMTEAVINSACAHLKTPRALFLEDLGTYLVSNPNLPALRRLLRFGGETFTDFLFSLDELPGHVRMAVPDLTFPTLEVIDHSTRDYTLFVAHKQAGFGHVLVGILRAMADEYGVLAYLEHKGRRDTLETVSIEVLELGFSEGREFALAANQ